MNLPVCRPSSRVYPEKTTTNDQLNGKLFEERFAWSVKFVQRNSDGPEGGVENVEELEVANERVAELLSQR